MQTGQSKMRLVWLLDFLKDTDEEHKVTIEQIIENLNSRGITNASRKGVIEDIATLKEFGYLIEYYVERDHFNRKQYYLLSDPVLQPNEIQVLIDAVQAANFIDKKNTESIKGRLLSLAGKEKRQVMANCIVNFKEKHDESFDVFEIINKVTSAISQGKVISYTYLKHDEKKQLISKKKKGGYIAHPYALIYNFGNYYLVCRNDGKENVVLYRIDRMRDVVILDKDIEPLDDFDYTKYTSDVFDMFGGETQKVTFAIRRDFIDIAFDRFGFDINIAQTRKIKGYPLKFTHDIQVSNTFYGWLLSYGNLIKVIEPESVILGIQNYIKSIGENYEAENE